MITTSLICKHESYNFIERETDYARWLSSFPETVSAKSWELWAKLPSTGTVSQPAFHHSTFNQTDQHGQSGLHMNKGGKRKNRYVHEWTGEAGVSEWERWRGLTSTAACWASAPTSSRTTPRPPPRCWAMARSPLPTPSHPGWGVKAGVVKKSKLTLAKATDISLSCQLTT